MKKNFLLLFVVAALAVSCRTGMSYTELQTRQLQPAVSTNVTPMAADLDVSTERIVFEKDYNSTGSNAVTVSKAKQYAIADVLKKYKADVLVAPLVSVTEENSVIHVTVCGYPATYKNFHKATVKEVETAQKMKSGKR